jgi:superfamily II RNA helicase
VRTFRVSFHRIRDLGEQLNELPPLRDRSAWEALTTEVNAHPFKTMQMPTESEKAARIQTAADQLAALSRQKKALPCDRCALFGPCQKGTAHPFSTLLQQYSELKSQMSTIQEQLWRSFQKHFRLLQEEGYVDHEGRLTEDGLWASKLRLDQPILISETIRKNLLPSNDPPLLAGLIATFVMDRERQGDVQLASFIYRYPDLAKPFFRMRQGIQPLRTLLQDEGFSIPPLPFWALTTVYHWAQGVAWDQLRDIAGMDEGDLAMVILRAADHLRQVESLADTHPQLAASAKEAIRLLLREPVMFD